MISNIDYFKEGKRKSGSKRNYYYGKKGPSQHGHIVYRGDQLEYHRRPNGKVLYDAAKIRSSIRELEGFKQSETNNIGKLNALINNANSNVSYYRDQLNKARRCRCGNPSANCADWRRNGPGMISKEERDIRQCKQSIQNCRKNIESYNISIRKLRGLLNR